MKRILNYFLSIIFYFLFGFWLVIFHPIQVVAYNLFGRKAQQKVVFKLNWLLVNSLRVLGTKLTVKYDADLPYNKPIIFLANHSSLHDITGIYGFFGKSNPVFVSKKSLATGIPSVSYNLRKSGAAIIDRKDRKQAISEILKLGQFIHDNNYSAVIFPEGTRRPGLQPFKIGGLNALMKKAPNAVIIPLAIKGTSSLYTNRKAFPLNAFQNISWHVLNPIDISNKDKEVVLNEAYLSIKEALGNDANY